MPKKMRRMKFHQKMHKNFHEKPLSTKHFPTFGHLIFTQTFTFILLLITKAL